MNDEDEARAWAQKVVDKSMEGISTSASYCGIITENFLKDPLCATQLGMSIFMDKPIILMVKVGTILPKRLEKMADGIVYFQDENDMKNASVRLTAILDKLEAERDK